MKKLFILTLVILSTLSVNADEQRETDVAFQLFEAMQLPTTFQQTIDQMLEMQIQQNPSIEPFKKTMAQFFEKYMGWESMKDDFAKMYMEKFTDDELRELIAFYKTPTGQKTAVLMPVLATQGAAIGQRRVQENMPELQLMIAEEGLRIAEKKRASKKVKNDSDE